MSPCEQTRRKSGWIISPTPRNTHSIASNNCVPAAMDGLTQSKMNTGRRKPKRYSWRRTRRRTISGKILTLSWIHKPGVNSNAATNQNALPRNCWRDAWNEKACKRSTSTPRPYCRCRLWGRTTFKMTIACIKRAELMRQDSSRPLSKIIGNSDSPSSVKHRGLSAKEI